ncbi:MAG: hypothetical protein FWH36_08855 [Lentimicrobiaceae bacterium]|nr:hypothetical protein [Lentimicrobiaceae bacterium]
METENIPNYFGEMEFEAYEDVEKLLIERCDAERVIWIDTTSSAGNWSGLVVKKVGEDQYDLIEFFQEIEFAHIGRLFIERSIVECPVPENSIEDVIKMYVGYYYGDGDAFEEDADFEDVAEQDGGNRKTLEIPFDD